MPKKPIVLTEDERLRFAAWLKQEAEVNEGLAEQMETLGTKSVAGFYRVEAGEYKRIARKLRNIQAMTVRRDK